MVKSFFAAFVQNLPQIANKKKKSPFSCEEKGDFGISNGDNETYPGCICRIQLCETVTEQMPSEMLPTVTFRPGSTV